MKVHFERRQLGVRTYCMTSEYVMLISSLVGETVVEPLLAGVFARATSAFKNAAPSWIICAPMVISLNLCCAWRVTARVEFAEGYFSVLRTHRWLVPSGARKRRERRRWK